LFLCLFSCPSLAGDAFCASPAALRSIPHSPDCPACGLGLEYKSTKNTKRAKLTFLSEGKKEKYCLNMKRKSFDGAFREKTALDREKIV
jgi:hypothetical protein